MIETALNKYSTVVKNLLPILQKQSKSSYIGLAILCLVAQQVYSYLTPPKFLRQFPKVSFFATFKSLYYNESVNDRFKRLVLPVIKEGNGFYVNRIPLFWTLYITDPVAAKQLLFKTDNFPKSHSIFDALGESSPIVQFMGRDNVATSNGDVWKRQRKVMNPAFHRSMPVKTFGAVVKELFTIIEKESDSVPITLRMKSMTLDILGLAAFDFNFQSLRGDPEGWTKTYNVAIAGLFNPWINIFAKVDFLLHYISPQRRRINNATLKFSSMLDELADKKREEILAGSNSDIPENEKDLLTLMIEADIRDKGTISNQELRHNIALFFLAGHDTTAHTLTFCLYNLAINKHVQKKARKEILHILGDEPTDIVPTLEELKQMSYLDLVLKENLRRSGPVDRLMTRETIEDIELAGTFIAKGTHITVDVASLHMSPKNWKNPEQFIPERFEEGGEYESNLGTTWTPFSSGSRQCLGINFSLTEQRVVLAMILRKFEIELPADSIHADGIVFDKPFNFAPLSLNLKFVKRY
ncbi:unnamed protein product [Mucor hiemalis]